MPKHKSLTVSHRIVRAGKLRYCHHDRNHAMAKGDFCFEVREGLKWKGYCVSCTAAMVAEAERSLSELKAQIQTS